MAATVGPELGTPYDSRVSTPPASAGGRVAAIDVVRGVVMILMAIDHVRVYAGVPAGGPTPGVFFTRWITHFVAPAFVFLAGTSAYLHGARLGDRAALSRFLLARGLWLVLLELTVIRVAWTFNLDFAHYMLAGVIWMLGWCMVLMAGLSRLSVRANAAIGVAIVALHNVTDHVPGIGDALGGGPLGGLWAVLYGGGPVALGGRETPLLVLFVLVPWIGVMMAGFAFGAVARMPAARRRPIALRLGVGATLAFVVLRTAGVYGDPSGWDSPLSFLATSKYPASLLFLLMTLGPTLVGLALAEHARGRVADVLATFGRVPLFYYLLHVPVIHVAACAVSLVREGAVNPWLFGNHPLAPGAVPDGYRWSLALLYVVFAICVTALYGPCRWFARVRAERRAAWLSYL